MTQEPNRAVLMFLPRFVEPIQAGRKRQTIRPAARYIRPGTMLSLRQWTGRPYNSRQEEITGPVRCLAVSTIAIVADPFANTLDVRINDEALTHEEVCTFVRSDGFGCVSDMVRYYADRQTLEFNGVLIEWEPREWSNSTSCPPTAAPTSGDGSTRNPRGPEPASPRGSPP